MTEQIAEVLLPVPLSKLFDYRLNGHVVQIGQRVLVEFGNGKQQVGLLCGLREANETELTNEQLKSIMAVLEDFPVVDSTWLALIRFASRYYAEPLGKAYRNALPKRLRAVEPLIKPTVSHYALSESGKQALEQQTLCKKSPKQHRLLTLLSEHQSINSGYLKAQGFKTTDINKALNNQMVVESLLSPYLDYTSITRPDYALNSEQQAVIEAIIPQLNEHQAHLLYGVTGSGKTEIYLQLIEQIIATGQQVLLLVPEIALTPQMLSRFTQRFGHRVAAYHSGISDNKRRDIFLAAQTGELPILIGTRSAVFVPMLRLGLILVDEEHDLSYKQHEGFLYHARDLALYRAKQLNINILLGSATPSLDSLYHVQRQRLQLHCLSHRATQSNLPKIVMIDRRGHGQSVVLADSVQQKMRQVLQNGKQVLLFLNRRGFSPVMLCESCGWRSDCPTCSVFQTAHVSTRQLCCHHCGHVEALPLRCPDCGRTDLYFAGAGTEKLESQLNQQFPQQHILRLDRDKQTTAKQLDEALAMIHEGRVDIILGTQLVVKGHHFPNVDMVCVVDADSALFSSDFRAEERLYQQLIQVAGRAGRESSSGEVYIQSNVPEHEVFHALVKQDYWSYAESLLNERIEHHLPPYVAMALVKASALDKPLLMDYLRAIKQALAEHAESLDVLGPVPLAIEKVRNRFQAKLWLSAANKSVLQKALPLLAQIIRHYDKSNRFKTIVDIDAQ